MLAQVRREVLPAMAIHPAGEDLTEISGEDHQTPLDHRTRL